MVLDLDNPNSPMRRAWAGRGGAGNQEQENKDQNVQDADAIAFSNMQAGTANPDADNLMQDTEATTDTTPLHIALAGAGMIPGIGIVADLFDAALYGFEGDIVGAGLSLISAVPALGLVSGAGRVAAGAAKVAPDVAGLAKAPGMVDPRTMGIGKRITGMTATAADVKKQQRQFEGVKKLEDQLMRNIEEFGEAGVRSGQALELGSQAMKAQNVSPKQFRDMYSKEAGQRINESLKGMRFELNAIKQAAHRTGLDEDRLSEILAWVKGNDAFRTLRQQGSIGGETMLRMEGAIARGARLFYALDGYTQNQVLQEFNDAPSEEGALGPMPDASGVVPGMPESPSGGPGMAESPTYEL